jgi:hypothetical protein
MATCTVDQQFGCFEHMKHLPILWCSAHKGQRVAVHSNSGIAAHITGNVMTALHSLDELLDGPAIVDLKGTSHVMIARKMSKSW